MMLDLLHLSHDTYFVDYFCELYMVESNYGFNDIELFFAGEKIEDLKNFLHGPSDKVYEVKERKCQ